MKHRNVIRSLVLGLFAALLLGGCGGNPAADAGKPSEAPSPPEAQTEDAPKDYSKYNSYLGLYEQMKEMLNILDVYFTNVEHASDFAMAEGGDYAAIKDATDFYTANTYSLQKALDYAGEEPSYARVDAAVRALGDSPLELMKAISSLSVYIQFGEYEKDNLARAPEIHAAIWEPLKVFSTYYGEFMNAVDELADELDGEGLEYLKNEGLMILYYSELMLGSGGDIIDEVNAQIDAANQNPDEKFVLPELDRTALAPLFDGFNTAYTDLMAAMEDEGEQAKVFTGALSESAMKLYTSQVNALYFKMGSLAQALNDGSDYFNAYDELIDAYNGMVGGYNSII